MMITHIHYRLSRSSYKTDILLVVNTHLSPGSMERALEIASHG
jgi:hypothetical protein